LTIIFDTSLQDYLIGQNSKWRPDTIQKNGADSKSQMSREIIFIYMKSKFILSIIFLFFVLISFNINAQKLNKEQAFFYFMKIYNLKPSTATFKTGISQGGNCGSNYLEYYANIFDSYNYNQSRNDEFKKNNYDEVLNNKLLEGINNVDFSNKYTISFTAQFGTYSFSNSTFPISFDVNNIRLYDECHLMIYIDRIVNSVYLDRNLHLPKDQAEEFLDYRKDKFGNIDRRIYLNLTYSILNRKANRAKNFSNMLGSNFDIYFYSIEIYNDEGLTEKLSTNYPGIDYYDKINGVKIKDGKETIYFDKNWKPILGLSDVSFYRIINYSNGTIIGTVKDYFISGKLQMEGTFNSYLHKDCKNGLFTYYYENGKKKIEENYLNGKRNGKYTSWYPSGTKKEVVDFVNGLIHGCYYKWDENGNCIEGSAERHGYVYYYENGSHVAFARKCPCFNIK
jgi:antitoxin component YwqK of YwqJK toxin-antitoxin module